MGTTHSTTFTSVVSDSRAYEVRVQICCQN